MNTDYEIGDIVQLKSGGPKMTVKGDHHDGEVHCQWFSGSKLSDGWFPGDSIQKVEDVKTEDKKV